MLKILNNLWQTTLEHPFPGLNTHAYVLKLEDINVLFYNTSNKRDIEEISELGGIHTQYLSHRHESGSSLKTIRNTFNSELCASEIETPYLDSVVDFVVTERQIHNSVIEVIPTPGHTGGGLCFWYSPKQGPKYLFTGDTIYFSGKSLSTLVFPRDGGTADDLIQSLKTLRLLTPDIVISSAFVGDTPLMEMSNDQWHYEIDTNIETLRKAA